MKESKHVQLNVTRWNKWANSYDGKGWRYVYLRKAQSSLISLLNIKENMNFLDIGCGTGWAIGQVAKLVDYKGSFYGVDLSPRMIEKAKENFKVNNNFHFINANSESIPLDDNLFDIIICTNSFHHYLNPNKAMKEIFRLLKPDGKIFILDPTADYWFIKIIDKIIKLIEPGHVKIYSTKEFESLLINAGLKYIGCKKTITREKVHIGEK
jgi:ubiquinone/menaquinone biosynthesis C-methylase UbiE